MGLFDKFKGSDIDERDEVDDLVDVAYELDDIAEDGEELAADVASIVEYLSDQVHKAEVGDEYWNGNQVASLLMTIEHNVKVMRGTIDEYASYLTVHGSSDDREYADDLRADNDADDLILNDLALVINHIRENDVLIDFKFDHEDILREQGNSEI